MVIEDNRHLNHSICFGNIDVGVAFSYNNKIYMRIKEYEAINPDHKIFNAINLLTGDINYFSKEDVVVRINSKIVVNYYGINDD